MMDTVAHNSWPARLREFLPQLVRDTPGLSDFADQSTWLLHGSTTRGIDDLYSDLDVWLLPPTEQPNRFIEFKLAGKPGHVQIESRADFAARVRRCDMPLLYELRHGILLQDPDGFGERLLTLAKQPIPADVREAWFMHHYIEMRSEHRGADNPISRGDPEALLLAVTATITHALRAAMVLDGEPYPYSKWLATAASKTPTGLEVAAVVRAIIYAIGTGALESKVVEPLHLLTIQLKAIRRHLITAARSNGLDGPWIDYWYLHLDLRKQIDQVTWEI